MTKTEQMIKGYERRYAHKDMPPKTKEVYNQLLNKLNKTNENRAN